MKCNTSCSTKCVGNIVMWSLVIIGAINWGLVGIFGLDVVSTLLGDMTILARIVYVLVGISGIGLLVGCRCKKCTSSDQSCCGCSCKDSSPEKPLV